MIRRLVVTVVALFVGAGLATGCTTFTKNNLAATVNGHELSVADYERAINELRDLLDPTFYGADTMEGQVGRNILGSWIISTATLDNLQGTAKAPTPEQLKTTESTVASSAGPGWDKLGQSTKDFILPAFIVKALTDADPSIDTQNLQARGITVDSRYGMWDPASNSIVATR